MKKMLFSLLVAGFAAFGAVAAEEQKEVSWPVFLGLNDVADVDLIGVRFNLYNGHVDQMTGFDFGIAGHANDFYGLQLNIIRNEAVDILAGVQIGIYNSAGRSDMLGFQGGLWNEAGSVYGIQAGLVNLADYSDGFQIGLINRTEGMHGYQIGIVNIIRDSQVPFCPIINIGF
ncbi:MAG: hypothetical protein IKR48_08265 [Kiritimatiellae bacterium]|nr:hypothetical protein [Kiritimatiellia bacterium]